MISEDLEPFLHYIVSKFQPVIVVHCDGNSIASMSLRPLQKFMKLTISNIQAHFPTCKKLFGRTFYREITINIHIHILLQNDHENVSMVHYKPSLCQGAGGGGGTCIAKCIPKLYRDGIHLSVIGQFIFFNTIYAGWFVQNRHSKHLLLSYLIIVYYIIYGFVLKTGSFVLVKAKFAACRGCFPSISKLIDGMME